MAISMQNRLITQKKSLTYFLTLKTIHSKFTQFHGEKKYSPEESFVFCLTKKLDKMLAKLTAIRNAHLCTAKRDGKMF